MKEFGKYITIFKLIGDFFSVLIAFFLARELRIVTDMIPNFSLPPQTIPLASLSYYAVFGACMVITVFLFHGLYTFRPLGGRLKELSKVFLYLIYSFIFFSVLIYGLQDIIISEKIPRLIIGFTFVISLLFIIGERMFVDFLYFRFLKQGVIEKQKIILIGKKKKKLAKIAKTVEEKGFYKVVGVYLDGKDKELGFPVLSFGAVEAMIRARKIDELLYIESDLSQKQIQHLWEICNYFSVKYKYTANSFQIEKRNTKMLLLETIPVLEIENSSLSDWNLVLKRLFDIIVALCLLIIFAPVFIFVALAIKLEDASGPIIFKNRRVGRKGKNFDLLKFRYMKWEYCTKESYEVSQEEKKRLLEYEASLIASSSKRQGPLYKIKNDPRKTKIGSYIEKYSIDELPQLVNVLKGDMSLVGPRPHQPREVNNYMTEHNRLLTIKPGITGLAQVNGRDENSFEDEVNYDIYYIENWNLLLDIKILFKTVYVVWRRMFE